MKTILLLTLVVSTIFTSCQDDHEYNKANSRTYRLASVHIASEESLNINVVRYSGMFKSLKDTTLYTHKDYQHKVWKYSELDGRYNICK